MKGNDNNVMIMEWQSLQRAVPRQMAPRYQKRITSSDGQEFNPPLPSLYRIIKV